MSPASVEADPASVRKVRLMIVDDHPIVRLGMSALLSTQSDFEVVGLAEDGEAALALLQSCPADVILLDLRLPGLSGLDTLKRIEATTKAARTIVVSSFEYDEEIYAAVKAGAQGFVHKEAAGEDILSAIRSVAIGKQAFPKHIAERLATDQMSAGLSARQIEILQLVARGLTNKEVATILNISQFTVRNHLNRITQKLEASDRTEAIFISLQIGLISSP
jgi:DNA-binding NarL/FixJ family response regulator